MNQPEHFSDVFQMTTKQYRKFSDIDKTPKNPYKKESLDFYLFQKNWIDNEQWDLEDLIREPGIDPAKGMLYKKRIEKCNKNRVETVEKIDDYFMDQYRYVAPKPNARINTESIGWAIDRLSILILRMYEMQVQLDREDSTEQHFKKCRQKMDILEVQKTDLISALSQLMEDLYSGIRIMKVYRQIKMYDDPTLNPILYKNKK